MTRLEERLYLALKRITLYMPVERLKRVADKQYGLSPEDALEMAYENVIQEAQNALRGVRYRRVRYQRTASPSSVATLESVSPLPAPQRQNRKA